MSGQIGFVALASPRSVPWQEAGRRLMGHLMKNHRGNGRRLILWRLMECFGNLVRYCLSQAGTKQRRLIFQFNHMESPGSMKITNHQQLPEPLFQAIVQQSQAHSVGKADISCT